MTIKSTRLHRLNRVINFIQANIRDDLGLHQLADVACLSRYHFIRVFDDHLGQTPSRYLNRVRLERAARQLVFLPEIAIGGIASSCGFDCQSSFSRAFGRHFLCAPQEFRNRYPEIAPESPIAAFDPLLDPPPVRIIHQPETRIAYIRHFGAYHRESPDFRRIAETIRNWAETARLPADSPIIGICPDNRRITPTRYCVYDIGIRVGADFAEDDIVSILTIPAGQYAVASVNCRNEQLISAWDWLVTSWRNSVTAPYFQNWNYEVFPHAGDASLDPERGVHLCLRISD